MLWATRPNGEAKREDFLPRKRRRRQLPGCSASQSYPSSTSIKHISNLLQTITSLRCSSETGRWRPDVVTQYGSRTRLKAWPTAPPFLAVARTKAAINVERANVDATSK